MSINFWGLRCWFPPPNFSAANASCRTGSLARCICSTYVVSMASLQFWVQNLDAGPRRMKAEAKQPFFAYFRLVARWTEWSATTQKGCNPCGQAMLSEVSKTVEKVRGTLVWWYCTAYLVLRERHLRIIYVPVIELCWLSTLSFLQFDCLSIIACWLKSASVVVLLSQILLCVSAVFYLHTSWISCFLKSLVFLVDPPQNR